MQIKTISIIYEGNGASVGNTLRTGHLTMRQLDLFIKDFKKMLKASK